MISSSRNGCGTVIDFGFSTADGGQGNGKIDRNSYPFYNGYRDGGYRKNWQSVIVRDRANAGAGGDEAVHGAAQDHVEGLVEFIQQIAQHLDGDRL